MTVKNTHNELLRVAKIIKLPEWATHVAVSKVRENYAEPCAWVDECQDYIDENPAMFKLWAGSYKHVYWQFFTLEELL